jgi:hypothetical protein
MTYESDSTRIQFQPSKGYLINTIDSFNQLPTFILEVFGLELTDIYNKGLETIFLTQLKESIPKTNQYSGPENLYKTIQTLISKLTELEQVVKTQNLTINEEDKDKDESDIQSIVESPKLIISEKTPEVISAQDIVDKVQDLVDSEIPSIVESPVVASAQGVVESAQGVVASAQGVVASAPTIDICEELNKKIVIESYGKPSIVNIENLINKLRSLDGISLLIDQFDQKKLNSFISDRIKKLKPTTENYKEPEDAGLDRDSMVTDKIHTEKIEGQQFNLKVKLIDLLDYLLLYMINKYVNDSLTNNKEIDPQIINNVIKYVRPGKSYYHNQYYFNTNLGLLYSECKKYNV